MILGILSDTHGRIVPAKAAIALLRERGAEFLIHCGDVGAEPVIDLLAGIPSAFVWGNNDFERVRLANYAQSIDVQCLNDVGTLSLDGKQIAVTHGDDDSLVGRIIEDQQHDYLFVGHSHIAMDQRLGRTRVVNPGALHRAAVKSVALLDTRLDQLEFITVRT